MSFSGHFSRDTTCNTMSTSADIYSREISREFTNENIGGAVGGGVGPPLPPNRPGFDYKTRPYRRSVSEDYPVPPPPPPPSTGLHPLDDHRHRGSLCDLYEFEDVTPPRREYSYDSLRRTTPV